MGELSPTHWLIVIVVAVVLFGARRLPDAARGLGRSVRILKAEMSGATDETRPAESAEPDPAPAALPAPERAEANRAATGETPASEAPAAATGSEAADQPETTQRR